VGSMRCMACLDQPLGKAMLGKAGTPTWKSCMKLVSHLYVPVRRIEVQRVWRTPGGRVEVHALLPAPLAAALLSSSWRLAGTSVSLGPLRSRTEYR
jgi:hypothetical protein